MGVLVKTAQRVENEFGWTREHIGPRLRSKLREAKAEWLDLKTRGNASVITRAELRLRAALIRANLRIRMMIGRSKRYLQS